MTFKQIAESLLNRSLTAQDGIDLSLVNQAQELIAYELPEPLKEFYTLVGKLPQFTSTYQIFIQPEQLYIDNNLLVFLEDPQGVCYWGVDKQGKVSQCYDDKSCYDMELYLQQFLELILYYQVAQGAEYKYCSGLLDEELEVLFAENDWEQVVNHDNLIIYHLDTYLLWFFLDEDDNVLDDIVYFVSLHEIPQDIIKQYDLEVL